jgi:hypothetical protein
MRTMLARQLGRDIKPGLRARRLIQMNKNFTELHLSLLPRDGAYLSQSAGHRIDQYQIRRGLVRLKTFPGDVPTETPGTPPASLRVSALI